MFRKRVLKRFVLSDCFKRWFKRRFKRWCGDVGPKANSSSLDPPLPWRPMQSMPPVVAVVDDKEIVRRALYRLLRSAGFDVLV